MAFGDQYPSNLQYALVKAESTYGTDSVPDDADFVYMEDKSILIQTNSEQRTGFSDNRVGWGAVATNKVAAFSFSVEMKPITIAGDTDTPVEGVFLEAGGFNRTPDTGGDPKRQVYSLQPTEAGSFTLYDNWLNVGKTEGILQKVPGCRCTVTFNITKNTRWKMNVEGEGKPCDDPETITSGTTPPIYSGLVDTPEPPLVGTGARVSIYDTVAGVAFGGGTEAAPLCDAFVDSAEISMNMGVTRRDGINCADGCGGRVELRPGAEYLSGTMVMEITNLADWNYWAIQSERRPVKIVIEQPSSASGVDGVRLTMAAELTDFSVADNEGNLMATCTWIAIYPEASGEFGTTTADVFTVEYFTVA